MGMSLRCAVALRLTARPIAAAMVAGVGILFAPISPVRAQTAPVEGSASVKTQTKPPAVQTSTLTLRWLKPSEFVLRLAPSAHAYDKAAPFLLPGLSGVFPDDAAHHVFVVGTTDAYTKIQELARLLDVEPRRFRLNLRILRAPTQAVIGPNGKLPQEEVAATASVEALNGQPLTLQTIGDGQTFRISVTPRINRDNSVTLSADFSDVTFLSPLPHPAEVKDTRLWTRRLAGGTPTITASVPNRTNREIAYFLEITPIVAEPTTTDTKPEAN